MKNIKTALTKDKVLLAALIIWLASVILPVVIACGYALPSVDDFYFDINQSDGDSNLLILMLQHTKYLYFNWQGTFLTNFIVSFPALRIFGVTGLRIFLILYAVIFFVALSLLVNRLCYWLGINDNTRAATTIAFSALVVMFLISGKYEDEIFNWYTGACAYLVPLTLLLFCVDCFLAYERRHSYKSLILGCILAFFAVGGSLNCSAMLCAILLFLILYNFIVKRTISKSLIIGIFALAGSLVTALAPGNYVRHGEIDGSGVHFYKAFFDCLDRFKVLLLDEFKGGLLPIVLIVVFILAFSLLKNSKIEFKFPILVTLYALCGIFITDFPVVLGYSTTEYWPTRVAFVERLALIVFLTFAAVYWGGFCAKKINISLNKKHYLFVALAIVIIIALSKDFTIGSYKVLLHLAKGDYAAVAESELDMLDQIEKSDGGDVVVYYTAPAEGTWTNLKLIGIYTHADKTAPDNVAVANFYGVDSLQVVESEK